MTVLLEGPMVLRSRLEMWLERVLPYLDPTRERRRRERFERQLAKSRTVQAEAITAINESRRARRAHLRGSFQSADDRLARR